MPGQFLPNLEVFKAMSLLYISLGVAWACSYAKFWRSLSIVHHCATLMIALGIMEMSLR